MDTDSKGSDSYNNGKPTVEQLMCKMGGNWHSVVALKNMRDIYEILIEVLPLPESDLSMLIQMRTGLTQRKTDEKLALLRFSLIIIPNGNGKLHFNPNLCTTESKRN